MNHSQRNVISGYKALTAKIGGSRVKVWRDVRDGLFPAPIVLGPNSVGWYEDEVEEWLASRPRRTYGAETPYKAEPATRQRGRLMAATNTSHNECAPDLSGVEGADSFLTSTRPARKDQTDASYHTSRA